MSINVKFWLKTLLHLLTPGGYGYYRRLRRYRDPSYKRDAYRQHVKQGADSQWKQRVTPDGVSYRLYENYDQYIEHQKQKLELMLRGEGGHGNRGIARARCRFWRRFWHLHKYLPKTARIVCLGARLGVEVEVLRDLGYRNAYGTDLNPGPDNPYVIHDDFMHMQIESDSLDMVYTNCIDHAFDLPAFFAEHARVIKDDGYAMYDLARTHSLGAFESVAWHTEEALTPVMLRHFRTVVRSECESAWRWILLQGKGDLGSPTDRP